jgi:hypothetical protein
MQNKIFSQLSLNDIFSIDGRNINKKVSEEHYLTIEGLHPKIKTIDKDLRIIQFNFRDCINKNLDGVYVHLNQISANVRIGFSK